MDIYELLAQDQYLNRKYVQKNNLDYEQYKNEINRHNQNFVAQKYLQYKSYFENMFALVDSNIKLDYEQIIAILTDEDYNLIIAGAGAGKTTTMIAKIKYLIEKRNANPDEILALSFGHSNAEELNDKLNGIFHLGVTASTFHKLGMRILEDAYHQRYDIASTSFLYQCTAKYLKEEIYKTKSVLSNTLDFLIEYFQFDPTIKDFDSLEEYHEYKTNALYQTIKDQLPQYNKTIISKRHNIRRTIKSEYLRSKIEVNVANYLFLNNLDYEYEQTYFKLTERGTHYHPDFTVTQGENKVYIEVLSTSQNGESDIYTPNALEKYNFQIDMKKRMLAEDHQKLILLYSSYDDHRSPLSHLEEELKKCGFVLLPRNDKEVYDMLAKTNINSYFHRYILLSNSYIEKCKRREISVEKLYQIMVKCDDERSKKFIQTIIPIYQYYQNCLKERNMIDFDDMIILAKNAILKPDINLTSNYRYIIIDEYQDISDERFELIKNLSKLLDSEIIAVGDDWQSIFSFAGSNVELFTRFQEEMGYAETLKIQTTYRNSQELIDIAGDFIQKNKDQIKKRLRSKKSLDKPISIYSYDDEKFESRDLNRVGAIHQALETISKNNPDAEILLLGRYNFKKNKLLQTKLFQQTKSGDLQSTQFPNLKLTFQTMHKAKGLEYDEVIIINAINATYGFPSKVQDDPIFNTIEEHHSQNMNYAEERRLFYVALTRTKNTVSIIVPRNKPSAFVLEIKDNLHVDFKDNAINIYMESMKNRKCPKCGAYLKYGFLNSINGYAYYCTTEKEVCGFICNSLNPKINLCKCPKCDDGYLCYKTTAQNNYYFLGCTNYDNGKCNYSAFIHPDHIEKGEINGFEKERWGIEEYNDKYIEKVEIE